MSDRFFVVGAQRSGTSYLYRMLDAHPEIEMARPSRPEPKFFIDESLYNKGLEFYESRFFSQSGERCAARGEKSTSYIEYETAASRIRDGFPEAKIIMIFRNPVDRAVSNYRFSVENGAESLPMDEAFRREKQRSGQYDRSRYSVSPFAYLRRGRYSDYLEMWKGYFPAARIRVLIFERLVGSLGVIQSVYAFLGVNRSFVPAGIQERGNASEDRGGAISPSVRDFLLNRFRKSTGRLAEALGDPLREWDWE